MFAWFSDPAMLRVTRPLVSEPGDQATFSSNHSFDMPSNKRSVSLPILGRIKETTGFRIHLLMKKMPF